MFLFNFLLFQLRSVFVDKNLFCTSSKCYSERFLQFAKMGG
jgi:hypothetical protein